jgi:hypothetical protein
VGRSVFAIAGRAIWSMIHNGGGNDILRLQAASERDGVAFNLAYIGDDFTGEREELFDRNYSSTSTAATTSSGDGPGGASGDLAMNFDGRTLSADAVRAYLRSVKEEEQAKRRAHEEVARTERDKLRQAFMEREVQPEAMDRIAALVRKTLEMGEKQALVLQFPSDWLPDQGRAITNHDRNWPQKLDGFPKKAYDFFARELEPRGFQLRAEVVSWPGGMPGDVGFFLAWKRPEET